MVLALLPHGRLGSAAFSPRLNAFFLNSEPSPPEQLGFLTTQDGDDDMADMQESMDITPEAVSQAAEAMIAAKPAYRDLISFYGRIFAAQEDARQRIRLEPVVIPEELLTLRRREQLPLVPVSGMAFDPAAAGVLLGEICGIAVDCGTGLAGSARILSAKSAGLTSRSSGIFSTKMSPPWRGPPRGSASTRPPWPSSSTTACGRRCAAARGSFPVS